MGMDLEGTNPRDNMRTAGSGGKRSGGSAGAEASGVPKFTSAADFDVFSGGKGITNEEYTGSTFHTSAITEGDAAFRSKAALMQGSGPEILSDAGYTQTKADNAEEVATKKEATQAAV